VSAYRIQLDRRRAEEFAAELLARRRGYVPGWTPAQRGPEAALLQVAARYWQTIVERLNLAPEKNKLAFLNALGVELRPAQAARTAVVFRLADKAPDARIPAGTRVAAPPAPGTNEQIIFETEESSGLAAAKLRQLVSLWPGRDLYLDHGVALLANEAFQLFERRGLQPTPHHIYLAHDTLLALAGASRVDVEFELTVPSSEHLDIIWEYWDGKLWRQFRDTSPQCDGDAAREPDSTGGLQFSGRFVLESDCAEAAKAAVGGVDAFWVRGRLNEPVIPGTQTLPCVESIKLSTAIARPLQFSCSKRDQRPRQRGGVAVTLLDEAGAPLRGLPVLGILFEGSESGITDLIGTYRFDSPPSELAISFGDSRASATAEEGSFDDTEIRFTIETRGLPLDQAFADALALDVKTSFAPFGQIPQPGSVFYFSHVEAFSKPGAELQFYVQPAATLQDHLSSEQLPGPGASATFPRAGSTAFPHTVSWEYWNGKAWATLEPPYTSEPGGVPSPRDLSAVGLVEGIRVPKDLVETTVNGQKALWMRVRLVSGAYGFSSTIRSGANFELSHSFPVVQAPVLSKFLVGYTWQKGPVYPERVLAYNDFTYEERTEETRTPGVTFLPFRPISDQTPAVYLGFDQKLPVDTLGILFNVLEDRTGEAGPALSWQYWNGFVWRDIVVSDQTRNLRVPGLVSLIGPSDSQPLARFDTPNFWLRARLSEDGLPGEPKLGGVFLNGVSAAQYRTVVDEPLGSSNGQANQSFAFTQIPVLDGESIEVRELAGLRANTEWRIVVQEVFPDDERAPREIEDLLSREGQQNEVSRGDVRLVRGRDKRVTEVWVVWRARRHLLFSGPGDRHYRVRRARGVLDFGDGANGRVPPAGAAILARKYRTGGGGVGNLAARSINQVLAPLGGIEEVFNPLPAEGGADTESMEALSERGPRTLRHRGRALSAQDYETLAREASPGVAFARAISCRDSSGRRTPGSLMLLLIPKSGEPQPWPPFELREAVRRYLEARAPADLAAAHQIHITGPDYLLVEVEIEVVPQRPSDAALVEAQVRAALARFLHPLVGGPQGRGWDLGRDVFISDVAALIERTPGVDRVNELALLLNGEVQGERVRVADMQMVSAGQTRVSVVVA
jgi:hypothetical protein